MEKTSIESASLTMPIIILAFSSILFISTFFVGFTDEIVASENVIVDVVQVAEKMDLLTFGRVLLFLAILFAVKQIRTATSPKLSHRTIDELDEIVGYHQAQIERLERKIREANGLDITRSD